MDKFQLFTPDSSPYGPYPARPVTATWHGYDTIAVTRDVAEKIADDLNMGDEGCGLTAEWRDSNLVFVWDKRYRGDDGDQTVTPGPDGLYEIGGLWPWMEWDGDTAGQQAIRALEKRGISADYQFYDGMAWLIITREQEADSHAAESAPCLLLDLHGEDAFKETDINRPGEPLDRWRVIPGSFEREPLIECPVAELGRCVEVIAEWVGAPQG